MLNRTALLLAVIAVFGVGITSCGQPKQPESPVPDRESRKSARLDRKARFDDLHLDLPLLEPTTWVRHYEPDKASSGYTLVLYNRRLPMLIDMNGNIVHVWPLVRAGGRARLNREGRLLVIWKGGLVEEYDWEGERTWFYKTPGRDLTHHDVIELANGNRLVLARDHRTRRSYLSEVDSEQNVVWRWLAADHLPAFPGWDPESSDPAHLNSINELPPNRWFDSGDARFRPGNILVSARNLNAIFIIDKSSGDVVWRYSEGLDSQHEAIMVERDLAGGGLITIFNNGLNNLFDYRRSRVQAIDPVQSEVTWEYSSKFFFSGTGGTARRLVGGNTLITSTLGGRVFEIDARGRIVWELVPAGHVGRAERVPYDHCPQLRALPRPVETDIRPQRSGPYVDADLFSFVPGVTIEGTRATGSRRKLLPWGDACRDLFLPQKAWMRVGCGIVKKDVSGESLRARFRISITEGGGPPETLLDVSIDGDSTKPWQWTNIRLDEFAYKNVTLCLTCDVDASVARPEQIFAWAQPSIRSKWQNPEHIATSHKVSEQELELRRRQLEALGYID